MLSTIVVWDCRAFAFAQHICWSRSFTARCSACLQVVPLRLPSLDVDVRLKRVPPLAQAYLAGLAFALAASPCSTPVLATLLAWVSSTEDPAQGAALLLVYTSGYVAPLLLAASVTVGMM